MTRDFFPNLCWYYQCTIWMGRCSHVSVDLNCVANLNSKEQKITCQPFMSSTVQESFDVEKNSQGKYIKK